MTDSEMFRRRTSGVLNVTLLVLASVTAVLWVGQLAMFGPSALRWGGLIVAALVWSFAVFALRHDTTRPASFSVPSDRTELADDQKLTGRSDGPTGAPNTGAGRGAGT